MVMVKKFGFNMSQDDWEGMDVGGDRTPYDWSILVYKEADGETFKVSIVKLFPEGDEPDSYGYFHPGDYCSNRLWRFLMNESWAKYWVSEEGESDLGLCGNYHGRFMPRHEVEACVRSIRKIVADDIKARRSEARENQDEYQDDTDLNQEKWDNYWAGEGYGAF